MSENTALQQKIRSILDEKEMKLFAHTYQPKEVQEVADLVADSLELARQSKASSARAIVLAGVHFMAESAAILAPEKKIILTHEEAGCPMADMVIPESLIDEKKRHPDALVVSYVNTSAEVKALSNVCCTSANAIEVVRNVPAKKIIFVPDKYLGSYVKDQLAGEKEVVLYPGYCPVHQRFKEKDVLALKEEHPAALTLCHPEAPPIIRQHADHILSTSQMIRLAHERDEKEFIILTERGIQYPLETQNPDKQFYFPDNNIVCVNMKKTMLDDVLRACETEEPVITVASDIREKAYHALNEMLRYG